MSDQQQASGDPSARAAASGTPDAEAVAAQLTGPAAGKPQTASTPEGGDAGKAAASEPEAGTGPDANTGTDPDTDVAAGTTPGTDTGKAAGEPAKEPAEEPAEAGRPEVAAEAETGGNAKALSAAATREQHEAVATAATGRNTAVATRSAVGRPRKPVLAGAALAGAILVAVPLLITVTDKDEEKKTVDNAAADTVLNDAGGPAGVFETRTPSPSKSDPEKKKEKEKKAAAVAAPPVAEEAAATTPKPSPSPSKKKKKATTKKAASTLPAVMTRVLIKNHTNGTCVDVPGFSSGRADGPVTHATCNSNTDDNQLWNVEKRYDKAGPGGTPLFQIRNVMDSMCLDLPGYQGVGGATKVTEFPCNGTTNDNQLWWLDKQSDGRFWIRNAASNNQCLDSYANNDSTRSLIIWPCAPEGQNNHEWTFTRS
ncbi:RICIN domain-containing protein [Streptomyces sp. DSM 40484]|uniref:RICIN domain-containing protein n=1 Tax=Streptomyces kroppenstedtii TaxID=3051181 RepID=UPI0028D66212|nr:ricin-type beta-trefoil lectin domain protein [Streptomyces sp. DSM 40484]